MTTAQAESTCLQVPTSDEGSMRSLMSPPIYRACSANCAAAPQIVSAITPGPTNAHPHFGARLGPDRIKWVHPDCGFWMNKRSIADRKMEALVKGRDLYLGRR
jgi:hypothetical protein